MPRAKAIIIALTVLFAIIALKNAWLSDDAYITFRTIDNFLSGYGLTYNIAERVQAYTHPLWMFLLSAFYFATGEIYYTSIMLAVALALATLLLLVRITDDLRMAALGITLLICSKAFVDYTTSGLENPLSHFLLAAFLALYWQPTKAPTSDAAPNLPSTGAPPRVPSTGAPPLAVGLRAALRCVWLSAKRYEPQPSKRLFWLSLVAALAALNRVDTLLIYLPLLAHEFWRVRSKKAVAVVLLGFLPLLIWTGFSLLYYGAPFPNTAYAKLNTGVNPVRLAVHGLYYFTDSLTLDPLTLVTIAAGLILAFWRRRRDDLLVAAGIILYLLYIIKIGGDFMSGRFFTLPFLAAVVLISRNRLELGKVKLAIVCVVIIALSMVSARTHLFSGSGCGAVKLTLVAGSGALPISLINEHGICDERAFYFQGTGLFRQKPSSIVDHPWARDGLKMRSAGPMAIVRDNIGFYGYYAGAQTHVFDLLGLVDPLLARMPVAPWLQWRVGHFPRELPEGYPDSIVKGKNRIADPNLAAFYDVITLVTRRPLFERGRIAAIWKLNTGGYDHLVEAYMKARLTLPGRTGS